MRRGEFRRVPKAAVGRIKGGAQLAGRRVQQRGLRRLRAAWSALRDIRRNLVTRLQKLFALRPPKQRHAL